MKNSSQVISIQQPENSPCLHPFWVRQRPIEDYAERENQDTVSQGLRAVWAFTPKKQRSSKNDEIFI